SFSIDKNVEIKGHSNFVTNIDKLSEEKIVAALSQLIPESGFIAEEGTSTKIGEIYNWIIDPIDGTTNFIHGLTPHAISIALKKDDKIVLGVVYEISHGEMFYAWEGSKAFLNDKVISVSTNFEHQNALIATEFPYYDMVLIDKYIDSMREIMEKTSGIRRLGSAAIDICYVACGRFEAFWEYGLHPWDIAAAAFIVQQAGGKVCDFNGSSEYLYNGQIITTNSIYFSKFYEIVHKHLGN
ncbi:MAG: inositol monophosphatase family protein, partial [Prolixibacteraceae bacterium]|nr:inositol monophosphatase family protein [Prolixibacteraceae bacterium]